MPLLLTSSSLPLPPSAAPSRARVRVTTSADVGATGSAAGAVGGSGFPSFLPRAVERIRDGAAIHLAKRIERLSIQTGFAKSPILSSCVRPLKQQQSNDPVVLLHGFDSSCLEWSYTYPLLEEAGLEAWAVDILGWGFSNLGLPNFFVCVGDTRVRARAYGVSKILTPSEQAASLIGEQGSMINSIKEASKTNIRVLGTCWNRTR